MQQFTDVSDSGSGSAPGHMNFSPFGTAFVDEEQITLRLLNGRLYIEELIELFVRPEYDLSGNDVTPKKVVTQRTPVKLHQLTKDPERDWAALTKEFNVTPIVVNNRKDLASIRPNKTFKWVISSEGELIVLVLKDTEDGKNQTNSAHHPMATAGGPVYAAGLGQLGEDGVVKINNKTGHYSGAASDGWSLKVLGRVWWAVAGFQPKVVSQNEFPPLKWPNQ
jgi:hypothetical protein